MHNTYGVLPVSNCNKNSIIPKMRLEDIIEVYFEMRRNKRKSPDQAEFEMHWEKHCLNLYNDIINRDYRPTSYTFVTFKPKPREIFASSMSDRILHHYLDNRLRPLLERRMHGHTYNNRVSMGTNACQNAVISDIYEVSRGFTRDAWIIKLDLSGCFPNIVQDVAYRQLEEVILEDYHEEDKDDLLYVLRLSISSYPTERCTRRGSRKDWDAIPKEKSLFSKPEGIGAGLGRLPWQLAVNYYFHALDEWLLTFTRYERYVDDMYFVTDNKTAFHTYTIPKIREYLAELGASLNENKFYCQHVSKGCECLGVHIKRDRVYPNTRIVRRGKEKARSFNRCVREPKTDSLLASLNSYLGICKGVNGYRQALSIVRELSSEWNKYVEFDRHRCCLVARDSNRNRIIKKFNLK